MVSDTDYTIKARARGNTGIVAFTFKGNYRGQITRSYVKDSGSGDHSGTGTNNGISSGGTGNRPSAKPSGRPAASTAFATETSIFTAAALSALGGLGLLSRKKKNRK